MKLLFAAIFSFGLANSASAFDQKHLAWNVLLQKHVVLQGPASKVDYVGFKKDMKWFEGYLHSLSAVSKSDFAGFTREQQMAFLINAYNAFTIKLILDHYPVKSIKDIGSFFTSSWKIKFFHLLGEEMYLDQIEHENLRKIYKEPRVHFAVNCASIGCPALRNEAYVGEKLKEQLDQQAKLFLRDSSRNKIDANAMKLELSMIFKWFKEDFERDGNSVQKFISAFITDDPKIKAKLNTDAFSVSYLDYDWSLNKAGN